VKFAWIQAEKARYPIQKLCRWLGVTTSGFHAWCKRPESARAQRDRTLTVLVRASFDASKQRYGSPRIHEDLLAQDERVSRKRVIRLMQAEGLKARGRKRFKCTTINDPALPVAANLLNRQFTAEAPNRRWVGDTTEFVIGERTKLYLAAILDLYSRFIVGWAISPVNDRHLTINALEMALKRRAPAAGLLHHSDQGCTYASEDYQAILDARRITCSMSRRGDCYDNAVMESFFSTVKSELADRFNSFGEAKLELFDYIEVFYNRVSYCPTRLCG
jgi:putative transposase